MKNFCASLKFVRSLVILFGVLLYAATSGAEEVRAQSLFGSRGPLSQGRGGTPTSSPSSSPTLPGAGSLAPTGGLAPTTPGGFIGRGNTGGRFVGAQQAGQQRASATSTGEALEPRSAGVQREGAERQVTSNERPGSVGTSRQPIRARERIAFTFSAPEPASIDSALSARFAKLAVRYPVFAGLTTEADDDGRVTLRGEVPSDAEKRLAEILVRLQPGVRAVANELTVPAN
jgi:hypothetical protein